MLRREGADRSATDVIREVQSTSIATLVAEYNTIVSLADGERWEKVLRDAGLDDAEFAQAQNSDGYQTLLAQLREAESRGFDLRAGLSTLVNIRSFRRGRATCSATLTHRIARYVAAMGYPRIDQLATRGRSLSSSDRHLRPRRRFRVARPR